MKRENWLKLRDEVNTLSKEECERQLEEVRKDPKVSSINSNAHAKRNLLWQRLDSIERENLVCYDNPVWITKIDLGYAKTHNEAYDKALSILSQLKGVEIEHNGNKNSPRIVRVYTKYKIYEYATHYHYGAKVVGQKEIPWFNNTTHMQDIYETAVFVQLHYLRKYNRSLNEEEGDE